MRSISAAPGRLRVGLPIVLATALITAACGGGSADSGTAAPAAGGKLMIRGVVANTSDALWTTIACGATREAKARGIDFKFYAGKTTDATELNTNVNAALLDKPQAFILDSPTVDQFSAKVQTLLKSGVPVASSIVMKPPAYVSVVADQAAPPAMIKLSTDVLQGGGSVFTVGGSAAVPVVAERYNPLLSALKAISGVKVLPVQFTDFDPTKTQTTVNSAILANPDLKLVIASTGPEGQGAAAALKQSKRTDIKLIAFDAVPAEVAALKDGTIMALGAQPAEEIGKQQIALLADYLDKNPGSTSAVVPASSNPAPPMGVLTKENVDSPEMSGYVYKNTCDVS